MSKQEEIDTLQKKLDRETNHRHRLQLQVDALSRQRRLLATCLGAMSAESDVLNNFASGYYEMSGPGAHHFRYRQEEEE